MYQYWYTSISRDGSRTFSIKEGATGKNAGKMGKKGPVQSAIRRSLYRK